MPLKPRAVRPPGSIPDAVSLERGAFKDNWPALWEFLCSPVWEDGTPRLTGTMTIFVDDGTAKTCLKDHAQGVQCFVSGKGIEGMLDAADALIADDEGDWKPITDGRRKKT